MKDIWRKNFDIRRVDINLPVETLPGFGGLNHLTVDKNVISKMIWVAEDLNNTGTYFLKEELRELIELTINKILNDPQRIARVHKQTAKLNWQYFRLATKIRALNIPNLTNKQLLSWRDKLFQLQYASHCWSLPTTWYVDSDGEDFSKLMTKFLEGRIKELNLDLNAATVYSILSTPNKGTFGAKEETESLKILSWIRRTPKLKHWFMSHTTEELVTTFAGLPVQWKKKMSDHYKKWLWMPYTYIGPAYEIDYFLEVWRGLLHEDIIPEHRMNELKERSALTQQRRRGYIRQLKLSKSEASWFDTAAEIVWLKGFRKDTFFHGFYVLDLLLKEVGKRSGLSLIQAKYLLPGELPAALNGKDLSNIANDRIKFNVIYGSTAKGKNYRWTEKGVKIYTGQKAKDFLKRQKFEKVKIVKTDHLAGSCACPGTATGTIKTINVPEEMGKMQQGDIMLSHTTFPALVPAMKKAAAIITEDGGITCHAAIVARELQTPCIVGCKNALAILKDGDKVEVDANTGTVRLIKK